MDEVAQIIVVLVLSAIAVNLIIGGPERVKQWFAAKFLGDIPTR